MLKKQKIIIIDGYNVLRNNAKYAAVAGEAPNFKDWTSDAWNAAREALLNDVCQLVDKNTRALIVYDAACRVSDQSTPDAILNPVSNIQVIFTNKRESADSRIQKLVYMYRQKGQEVEVVTSDLAIQDATMNEGVVRTSTRAFATNVSEISAETPPNADINIPTSKDEASASSSSPSTGKLENCVDPETAEKLRTLRDSLN